MQVHNEQNIKQLQVYIIPLLHLIPTTICNRVSPVSVLKLGLSPRLTMDLNFSTFFALTDSSI